LQAARELCAGAGALLLALCAWLALPRADPRAQPTRPAARVVVVDGSASVVRPRLDWARWVARRLRAECAAAAAAGEELAVVRFGADVERAFGPGAPAEFEALLLGRGARPFEAGPPGARDLGSDLDGALALAAELLGERGRAPGRLVLLGDDEFTGTDPGPRLAALRRDGHALEWVELPPAGQGDLAVARLLAPRALEEGAPLAVGVELRWRPGTRAEDTCSLSFELRAGGVERAQRVVQALPGGRAPDARGDVRWLARVELGTPPAGDYEVVVRAALDGDRSPENDRARARVRVGEVLSCVALAPAGAPRALAERFDAARFAGVQIDWVTPAELPRALTGADVLLTVDVGPEELPLAHVAPFVRGGGGWLALGGWGFLRGFGDPQGAAALLPLVPREEAREPRDVVLLVDGSGSMAEPFEFVRRAVFELVPAAPASDRVELRFFTGILGGVEFATEGASPAERRAALAPLLEARVPAGGTDIPHVLRALAEERLQKGRRALVLLVTDGRTSAASGELAYEQRQRLIDARADLRVLMVGKSPDRRALERLLGPGEELVDARRLDQLPRLLQEEVNAERVVRGTGLGAVLAGAEGLAVGTPERALVESWQAAPGSALGPLAAHVRAEAAPGAHVLWRTSAGDPLLALHAVGAGRVAACGTYPSADWGPFLVADAGLLAPLLRVLGRGAAGDGGAPRADCVDGRLVLDGVPLDWPAELELALAGAARRGALGQLQPGPDLGRVRLVPGTGGTALDPRARRAGPLPAALDAQPAGAPLVGTVRGGGRVLAELALDAPGPAELCGPARRLDRALPPPRRPPDSGPPRAPHPAAPWAAGAGVLLLAVAGLLPRLGGQGNA
jgi:Mg-chelatase subunit ChlD